MMVLFYNGQVADIPFTLLQGKIEVSFNVSFIYCSLTALKTEPMWKVTTESQNEYALPASPNSKTIVDVVGAHLFEDDDCTLRGDG